MCPTTSNGELWNAMVFQRSALARFRMPVLVVAVSVVALLGFSLTPEAVVLVLALLYALLLVALAREARRREQSAPFAVAALVVAVLSIVLAPLTWGSSLFLVAFGLPFALAALRARGRTRWLALLATLMNGAVAVLLALFLFAPG
jgi:hypothetical protein